MSILHKFRKPDFRLLLIERHGDTVRTVFQGNEKQTAKFVGIDADAFFFFRERKGGFSVFIGEGGRGRNRCSLNHSPYFSHFCLE